MERVLPLRDDRGRFVPLTCPRPNCDGKLHYEGNGVWHCDGLVDPENPQNELQACNYVRYQGEKE